MVNQAGDQYYGHISRQYLDALVMLMESARVGFEGQQDSPNIDELACRYCSRCSGAKDAGERRSICHASTQEVQQCGILHPNRWQVVETLLRTALAWDQPGIAPAARKLLNKAIMFSGAIVPTLVEDDDGRMRQGYAAPTLMGRILLALLVVASYSDGDVLRVSVKDQSAAEVRSAADAARKFFKEIRDQRLAALVEQGSIRGVAREKGISRNKVRRRTRKK